MLRLIRDNSRCNGLAHALRCNMLRSQQRSPSFADQRLGQKWKIKMSHLSFQSKCLRTKTPAMMMMLLYLKPSRNTWRQVSALDFRRFNTRHQCVEANIYHRFITTVNREKANNIQKLPNKKATF